MLRPVVDYRPALTAGEGVGRYTRELCRALAARGDVALALFGATWAPAPHLDEVPRGAGARLFRVRAPSKFVLGALERFGIGVERLFRGGADLVHHTQYRRLPTRLPEVATVHDLVYLDSARYVAPETARRMSAFAREVARTARILVTPSATVADEVAERLDVPRERIVATLLGCEHAERLPRDPRAEAEARGRSPYLFTLGRIEPRKNHLGVLRALEHLGSAAPHWVVAGPLGDGADEFVRALERSPLRARVDLVGRIDEARVRAHVEAALAFVLVPFDEGFGLAPLEAMRLGAPVVTSDVPVVREVCGAAALLVDPADVQGIARAIERASGAPERAALVERGRDHAAAFTWTRTAAATLEAYVRAV